MWDERNILLSRVGILSSPTCHELWIVLCKFIMGLFRRQMAYYRYAKVGPSGTKELPHAER